MDEDESYQKLASSTNVYTQLIIVGVFTYITVSIFLSLFDEAVISLMTCLNIDTDLHETPIYGPPTFHDGEYLTNIKNSSN